MAIVQDFERAGGNVAVNVGVSSEMTGGKLREEFGSAAECGDGSLLCMRVETDGCLPLFGES